MKLRLTGINRPFIYSRIYILHLLYLFFHSCIYASISRISKFKILAQTQFWLLTEPKTKDLTGRIEPGNQKPIGQFG